MFPRHAPTTCTHNMHPRHVSKTCSHDMCPRYMHTHIHAYTHAHSHTHVHRKLGLFYPRVLRRIEIDLSYHKLPGLQKPVTFEFLDPLFAWSICAHKLTLHGHKLHFKYQARTHPTTGEALYGASVANGEFMRRACERGPPALIGISYDSGQASRRRSSHRS